MDKAKVTAESASQIVRETYADVSLLVNAKTPDLKRLKPLYELYTVNFQEAEKALHKLLSVLSDAKEEAEHLKTSKLLTIFRKDFIVMKHAVAELIPPTTAAAAAAPTLPPPVVVAPSSQPPRQELVKFSGDVREWLAFWACFQRYHDDPQIKVIDKFYYLLAAMVPGSQAESLVRTIPVCEANYLEVVNRLKECFGRTSLLIKVYVRELIKLIIQNTSGRKANFVEVVTQISSQVRNLDTLGVTKDQCGEIIYPIVESCLPEDIMMAWQRANQDENLDNLLAFLQTEVNRQTERKLAREQFGQLGIATASAPTKSAHPFNKNAHHQSKTSKATCFANGASSSSCIFCERNHPSPECRTARKWSHEQRKEVINDKGCCAKCLESGHFAKHCKSRVTCEVCGKGHYSVMCYARMDKPSQSKVSAGAKPPKKDADKMNVYFREPATEDGETASTSDLKNTTTSLQIPLQTICTYAFGRNGEKRRVRVMFDSGSQHSYILAPIAQQLNLEKIDEEQLIHQLFGGSQTPPQRHDIVRLYLGNKDGTKSNRFAVRCTDVISASVMSPPSGPWIQQFAKMGATFSDFGSPHGPVDILIGNDVRPHCFTGRKIKLHDGPGPVAEETTWGWVLSGKLPSTANNKTSSMLATNLHISERPISDLWALETIGIRDSADKESRAEMDKQVVSHFRETVTRDETGRYEVALPWLEGMRERLPNNYFASVRRLKSTTSKLKQSGYYDKYDSLFNQWEGDNMIERIPEEKEPHRTSAQYLPHKAVIKLSSATTPVRPVFDASAKLKGHPSLNECVDKGANTLELIPAILTRFRLYQVGVLADIKKAFQQISVTPADRDYLRFLWWEDSSCQKIRIYRHTRVVFGVSASPFLLGITLHHHLLNNCPVLPQTPLLLKNMYLDNVVASVPNVKLAHQLQQQSQELLLPAQFDLRGWELGPNNEDRDLPVLGLLWNMKEDTLRIDISAATEKLQEDKPVTQRILISIAHCLFDPLGIISPFTLLAKLLLRRCQEAKLGWDTPLPTEILKDMEKWASQLPHLSKVKVPRYSRYGDSPHRSLHVFCDASSSGYATVAYLRTETDEGVNISFLQARSRVAPKAKATIPRLELVSCTIAARLYSTMVEDMEDIEIPVTFWTDSSTALSWIVGDGPWGVFVGNRKAEINKRTDVKDWRHIPGKLNPADLPSRGCSAAKLVESRWWEGPHWLRSPPSEWPSSCEEADPESVEAELRKTVVTCTTTDDQHPFQRLLRVSHYPKFLRILANMVRFKRALREKVPRLGTATDETGEIDLTTEAEFALVKYIQQQLTKQHEGLKKLRPFKDQYGVIRTKTRLTHEDEEDFKNPIILPNNNELVLSLIRWEHTKNCHIGTEMLLAHLRERYWIIQGRRTVRKVVHSCWTCKRHLARPLQVPEAPLPSVRTGLSKPFATIGVDAAGPIILKKKDKVWIILFTCAVYRAVHLEVVEALSTDSFLRAFRHFVARRARPQIIYSDNGLNFVGAQRALVNVDWAKVQEYAQNQRIEWRFNTPTAAWHGGFFERMIGVVKGLLRRMLGRRVVHLQELITLCIEVEEAVNNRPLTYISEDPDDPQPLTPNHFVKNLEIPATIPEVDVIEGHHLRAAFRKLQRLREALRSRFRTEYVGQLLHNRHSGKTSTLQPGDVVLVKHENWKRQDWQLAIIVSPILSKKDGLARSYVIKMKGGETTRPAQNLCPMELSGEAAASLRDGDSEGESSTNSAQST